MTKRTPLSIAIMVMLLGTMAAPVAAQVIKNPSAVEWNCPEHDADSQHELKIIRLEGANKVVITTILLGDPAYVDVGTKLVRTDLNVQPIAFGDYVATLSVVVPVAGGGTLKSEESAESNAFHRAPGAPSKPIIK